MGLEAGWTVLEAGLRWGGGRKRRGDVWRRGDAWRYGRVEVWRRGVVWRRAVRRSREEGSCEGSPRSLWVRGMWVSWPGLGGRLSLERNEADFLSEGGRERRSGGGSTGGGGEKGDQEGDPQGAGATREIRRGIHRGSGGGSARHGVRTSATSCDCRRCLSDSALASSCDCTMRTSEAPCG